MINWIIDNVGTGPYLEVIDSYPDSPVVDVRDLVDKDGNNPSAILSKIEEALDILKKHGRVVICCDYGMSRSNSIAAAVIARHLSIPFSEAVNQVIGKVPPGGVKVEVLNSVFNALAAGKTSTGSSERLLLTGASGFIGKRVISGIAGKYYVKGVTGKEIDLVRNPVSLDLMVKEHGIDTLLHLANPRIYTLSMALGESLVMLKNALEVCRLNKLWLIYISSWEVYSGYGADLLIADESLPLHPKGSYGESKWLAEQLIEHYHRTYGLKYTILRSSPVYGVDSDKPKFIYSFLEKARKNQPIITHKYLNGFPKMDLLGIDDLVSALEKVVSKKATGIFNIGSGVQISTREVAERLVKQANSHSRIEFNSIDTYYPGILMDTAKARKELEWQPEDTFDDFVRKIV